GGQCSRLGQALYAERLNPRLIVGRANLNRIHAEHAAEGRAAFSDGFLKQPVRQRRCHERADGKRARAFAEDGDIVRIAAELGDIVAHPFERGDHIHQAVVARRATALSPQIFTGQKTENSHAVVDVHEHYAAVYQRRVGIAQLGASAGYIGSAVNPDHYRQWMSWDRHGRRVDVKVKTILARAGILKNVIGPDGP